MVGSTLQKIETAISNNYHSYNPLCEQLRLQELQIAKQFKEFTELQEKQEKAQRHLADMECVLASIDRS